LALINSAPPLKDFRELKSTHREGGLEGRYQVLLCRVKCILNRRLRLNAVGERKLMDEANEARDTEQIFLSAEAAASVTFASHFHELRGGDVPDEFCDEFEQALREFIFSAASGALASGAWDNTCSTRLAVYPELRERFDEAVHAALESAAAEVAARLNLTSVPAPTIRLVKAARDLWSAYLAFNLDGAQLH
jgi:hypothetical protein